MADPKQEALTFDAGLQASYATASDKMHGIVRSIVKRAEIKQGDDFAAGLGVCASQFSEALSGKGVKHFSLRWLPKILHADRDREFLTYCAALVGCVVVERAPLSDKQKLELLRAELREGGANVEALEARAYAKGER